jgi:hypothetical protein
LLPHHAGQPAQSLASYQSSGTTVRFQPIF